MVLTKGRAAPVLVDFTRLVAYTAAEARLTVLADVFQSP